MNNNRPPGEGKLFVVPRATTTLPPPPEARKRPLLTPEDTLIPLAVLFLVVVGVASWLFQYGNWEKAKDFVLIFLPPVTALMGAATAASFRS